LILATCGEFRNPHPISRPGGRKWRPAIGRHVIGKRVTKTSTMRACPCFNEVL